MKSFNQSADALMLRYNDDIAQGIAHLTATYEGLGGNVSTCSQRTRD